MEFVFFDDGCPQRTSGFILTTGHVAKRGGEPVMFRRRIRGAYR